MKYEDWLQDAIDNGVEKLPSRTSSTKTMRRALYFVNQGRQDQDTVVLFGGDPSVAGGIDIQTPRGLQEAMELYV